MESKEPNSNIVEFPLDPEKRGKRFKELKEMEKIQEKDYLQNMISGIVDLLNISPDYMTDEEFDEFFDPEKIKLCKELNPEFTTEIIQETIKSLERLKTKF